MTTTTITSTKLSSTITVETHLNSPGITLVRESRRGNSPAVLITLRPEVEDALLALLLKRKGITLATAEESS